MLSCQKASELTEKQTVYKLSPIESLQLQLHTKMCAACLSYQEQSKLIDNGIQRFTEGIEELKLSEQRKALILKALEQA